MLQIFTKSAIIIPSEQAAFTAAPICPPAPATPDVGERSVKNLTALVDLAYNIGDLAFAEDLVRRIYAYYDQQTAAVE